MKGLSLGLDLRHPRFRWRIFLPWLFLLLGCLASAGEARKTPKQLAELKSIADRYFQSGFYKEAKKGYTDMLSALGDRSKHLEILLNLGRSCFELGRTSPGDLQAAEGYFTEVLKAKPENDELHLCNFWLGRTYLVSGQQSPKPAHRAKRFELAIERFNAVRLAVQRSDLDYDAQYYRALSFAELAKDRKAAAKKDDPGIYEDTLLSFRRLALAYQDRPEAQFQLILYQLRSKNYEDAIDGCRRFIHEFSEQQLLAQVYLYLGESLYYSGRLLEAVKEYEHAHRLTSERRRRTLSSVEIEAVASPEDIRKAALYGLGWSYSRIARTGSAATRGGDLRRAASSFSSALKLMAPKDRWYPPAVLQRSKALIELNEHDEALRLLPSILMNPQFQLRGLILAGRAAAGAERLDLARDYFFQARLLATVAGDHELLLGILNHLADIESLDKRPERAILYCREACTLASLLRDSGSLAEARLNSAVQLLTLSSTSAASSRTSTSLSLEAYRFLLSGQVAPAHLLAQRDSLLFNSRATALFHSVREEAAPLAYEILATLISKHGERLRLDELYFHQGRALFQIGQVQQQKLNIDDYRTVLQDYDCSKVVLSFQNAERSLTRSLSANPQGAFAALTLYNLGRTRFEGGLLCLELANAFGRQGDAGAAHDYREKYASFVRVAGDPLLRAALRSADPLLANQARFSYGLVQLELDKAQEAISTFRFLLNSASITDDLRSNVILHMAQALRQEEQLQEALDIILPYKDLHRSLIKEAAGIYLELHRPSIAYKTFMSVTQLPPAVSEEDRVLQAALLFRGHSLGFDLAGREGNPKRKATLLQASTAGLRSLFVSFPDSPWAARAVIQLAQHYESSKAKDKALDVLFEAERKLKLRSSLQELNLALGQLLRREGRFEEAVSRFKRAGRIGTDMPESITLKARALLGIARTKRSQLDVRSAQRYYAEIWARFPGEHAIADLARFEAAEEQFKAHNREAAIRILKGAHDVVKSRTLRQKYERLQEGLPAPSVDMPPELTP
ncbi:MAG: hypothetical protein ACYTGH_10090 [Planctomycetota bacterium]|jgi:tetratricopeptide (TPR) repeat protein